MENIKPKCSLTVVSSDDYHLWIPADFKDFLVELDHIISACIGDNPSPLFRGHSDSKWMLDSTFARTCKKILFNIPADEIPNNTTQILHLLKYGVFDPSTSELKNVDIKLLPYCKNVICRPSKELYEIANTQGIDPWFELMKRIQQFPEKDHPSLKGTFILDWTKSKDVALYFANNDNNKQRCGNGAVYICDAVATGQTLIREKKVGEILELMSEKVNKGESMGCPLIFYPPKQLTYQREANQQVVYFAQMDLWHSLEEVWELQEKNHNNGFIYIKLILPDGTQKECQDYLLNRGITNEFIFPEN